MEVTIKPDYRNDSYHLRTEANSPATQIAESTITSYIACSVLISSLLSGDDSY